MGLSIADQYYLKAFDSYPFEMEKVVENLNYALSYDDVHAPANCMMGCVQMYVVKHYESAKIYFDQALVGDLNYPDTYKNYSLLLIWLGEFERAMKLIKYGLKVKGMDRKILFHREATIHEMRGDFEKVKSILKATKAYSMDENTTKDIEKEISRIKKKIKDVKQHKTTAKKEQA